MYLLDDLVFFFFRGILKFSLSVLLGLFFLLRDTYVLPILGVYACTEHVIGEGETLKLR